MTKKNKGNAPSGQIPQGDASAEKAAKKFKSGKGLEENQGDNLDLGPTPKKSAHGQSGDAPRSTNGKKDLLHLWLCRYRRTAQEQSRSTDL